MKSPNFNQLLRYGLIVFLVFQTYALPIHEYNLRQANYTIVDVQPWEVSTKQIAPTVTSRNKIFYNIAFCETHLLLKTLKQFNELFDTVVLLTGFLLLFDSFNFGSLYSKNDNFLTSLNVRAPPV